MSLPHSVGWESAIAPIMREQETGDPGLVAAEGQDHHVEHDPDVLMVVPGHSILGRRHTWIGRWPHTFRLFYLLLDLADTGYVLVKLLLVIPPEAFFHGLGILKDKVENGTLLRLALGAVLLPLGTGSAPEQAFKDKPWI